MKKRTSNVSRRIVSLLMSMVLTLTLVTPAAFATEVVGGSGTAIIEGNANPADVNTSGDNEGKDDENKDTEHGGDEQPTNPGDEGKNPDEDNGDDASKPDGDSKDKENPDGDKKDEENKNEQPTEDENNGDDEIALLNDENGTDVWDGTTDTSWYNYEQTTTFEISTAAQLAGLAALVNGTAKDTEGNPIAAVNFSGKTIKLTADIDLGNQVWTPIGNGDNSFAFSGTFDGDGYTISGLNVPDTNAPGLFGYIFGTVQNLIVKGSVTVGENADDGCGEGGGVVCDNNGTVQNCGFYGSVNDKTGYLAEDGAVGGVSSGSGKVLNCWYYKDAESSAEDVCGGTTPPTCVVISSSGAMTAAKLATLQTNAPETGKAWSWKEGAEYPTLVSNVSRSMTLKPYLNSCTAKVSVSGLTGESGVYLLENGVNTVTLLLDSGYSGENVYVRTNAANADGQIQLTTSGVSVPIGNAEKTILYYGTEEDFKAGKWYTAGDAPYQISTGRELVYLAQLVNDGNNFSGKTIVLTADIDLNNQAWTPIGNENGFDAELAFSGTFNGDGYTVSGLNVPDTYFPGLFGQISTSAVVQNLIVKGSVTGGDEASGTWAEAAGVAAYNDGCIQNCGFYGTVTGSSDGSVSVYGLTGSMGGGTVKNCWYFKGVGSGADDVCGGTATNCVIISSAEPMTADKLETLKTAAPDTGKVWSWKAGDAYPTLIDPPKTITMQPIFPDCAAVVTAGETVLNAENKYTCEVTGDTVTITVSGSGEPIYYTANEGENAYTTEGENANLTELKSGSTTFNKNDLPKTYYYGTEEDFRLLAAWNSAVSGKNVSITEANQLKALARMVNSGKDSMAGKTIMLGADIQLNNDAVPTSGNQWTPIGTEKNPFKGTFTGYSRSGGYAAISDLSGDLFGVVDNSKTKIQYVTIDGGTGRLVGELTSGTVEKCMSTAKVTGSAGGLVGQNSGTVNSGYYYNADSKNTPAVGGSGTVTKCFYLADTSTFGAESDTGARTAEEFQLGRVAYELGGSSYVWVYDTTKAEKMPQLGGSSWTMAVANELKLTKPDNQPEDVVVTLGSSDKKVLTDVAGNQYYYAASGYPKGVSDVPVTFTAPKGYQIVFTPATTKVDGKDYLRITGSDVEYTYSLIKADIGWYESHKTEKSYAFQNSDELVGLALLVNGMLGVNENFKDWTLSLESDIDLAGVNWIPIGQRNNFAGTFNGNNHAITGLSVVVATGYAGLFGNLTGTVQNLQVEGSVTASGNVRAAGGIVGYSAGGTVQNCLSKVNISAPQVNCPVGGVVGESSNKPNDNTASSTVNLCWNEGTVTGGSDSTGGIVGKNSKGTVTNCANFGEVKGSSTASGIVGRGAVANSYNLGDVTGTEGRAYGISSGAAVNSYYLCKLNGAVEQKYIKDSSSEAQNITATTEDNKTVYKVDGTELVELLNKNRSTYTEWINKQAAPYNPVHITRWDGSFEPGVEGVITLVYDPNGGEGAAVTEQQRVEGDTGSFTIKSDTELGFKHENGTFLGWSTNPYAKTADNSYDAGKTVSVEKNKSLTLYAVWSPIWAGSGTEAAPYEIPDVGKLTALQTQVNENGFSYTGKWFRLTNNIDLNNELWTPIGVDSLHFFGGSLDGGGKTISGLKVETDRQWAGLFGSVRGTYGVPMTMRDLTLKNGSVKFTSSGTSCSGGLVAIVEGETALELRNVVAENLTVSGGDDSGGLLGRGRVAMTNCHNRGGSVTGEYAGGLAGKGHTTLLNHVFTGCTNSAKVVGERTAGGMTGNETYNDGSYTSCANSGSISAAQGYASGIAAGGSYERCSNSGAVTGQQAAGIASNGNKATFCSNTGAIKGTDYAAGILTNGGYGGTVEFCWNTGSVEASTPVKAFGILYGWGAYNRVRNSFSYVPGANIGLAPTELKEENVTDSYYLADKKDSVSSAGEWASADDFASGKVAWGVGGKGEGSQGGTDQDAKLGWWKQDKDDKYPTLLDNPDMSKRYYRTDVDCGTGGEVELTRNASSAVKEISSKEAVYGPAGTSVTIKATPKDNTFGLKSLTWTHNGQTDVLPAKGTTNIVMPAESNVTIHAEFASVGPGGNGGYYYGGSGDGTGTGDKDDEGLQDGLNMDVEYDIKGLVLGAYAEWGSNGGNKSFQKWLEENPNVVRALLTNSLDNMATAAVGKKTDEAKDLAALLLASLNEHTGVDGKDGDTIAKALQKYIDSGSEEVFSAWLTGGGGMASGTYESIYGQYASSLAALADRLYSKWEASGTSMTFPVWLDSQQVSMDSLSENADEPDTDNTNDPQTSDAPDDVPDGQDTEGGASGNSVWEIIGTVVRENPILVWSIVAVIAALIIVGAVRRYHKVKRDEHDEK